MRCSLKRLNVQAGKPIAFLHASDARILGVHPGDRILIRTNGSKEIAVVDVTTTFIKRRELGLSDEVIRSLNLSPSSSIEVQPMKFAQSSILLKQKRECDPYTEEQLKKIMEDIVSGALTEAEIAYFISGINYCGMSPQETKSLVNAIVSTGTKLSWGTKKCADKHSIGGIPGNRTTPIVVAICAAAGVIMPKTSSRAITSAAGTADTVETLARVNFSVRELQEIVNKTGACLAWGGSLGLAPADDKIIQIEKILNLDPEPQLLASILSKKIAVGSKYVLIDIPYGLGAKVTRKKALDLKKKFLKLGKSLGLVIQVVLTEGSQPIGDGIGPSLEMRDIVRVLTRNNAPQDLEKKSIFLAGKILEMTKKAKPGKGTALARKMLSSGSAFLKFKEIIEAQGGYVRELPLAKYKKTLFASTTGTVEAIHNRLINTTARIAGCPQDKASGIDLHVHVGHKVKKGEPLVTLYAESMFKLKAASTFFITDHPIELG